MKRKIIKLPIYVIPHTFISYLKNCGHKFAVCKGNGVNETDNVEEISDILDLRHKSTKFESLETLVNAIYNDIEKLDQWAGDEEHNIYINSEFRRDVYSHQGNESKTWIGRFGLVSMTGTATQKEEGTLDLMVSDPMLPTWVNIDLNANRTAKDALREYEIAIILIS